jgi:hypothetical protein
MELVLMRHLLIAVANVADLEATVRTLSGAPGAQRACRTALEGLRLREVLAQGTPSTNLLLRAVGPSHRGIEESRKDG